MLENTIKYLTNPITSTLLFELEKSGEATAKQLASHHPDITHATLYRSLNRMCRDGLIQVTSETKVRGTYEKAYKVSDGFSANINTVLLDKDGKKTENFNQEYLKFFIHFTKGLIKEFQDFASNTAEENADCGGFTIQSIYASDEEIKLLIKEISECINKKNFSQVGEGKKLRNVAIVVPPVNRA